MCMFMTTNVKFRTDIEAALKTLREIFQHFTVIPEVQMDEFMGLFSVAAYPKKSVIIPPATKDGKLYFIISGLVRIYYEAEGKEITSDFKEEHTFFTNGYTHFTGLPNIDYHVAIEDTICLVAENEKIEQLMAKYHAIEHLGRKIVEKYYTTYMKANYNKLFLSADERYDVFVRERAAILNRLPLRYVATYLGITPETLSRLRAKQQTAKS